MTTLATGLSPAVISLKFWQRIVRDFRAEDFAPNTTSGPDVDFLAHLRLGVVHVAEQLGRHVPRAAAVVLARVRHVRINMFRKT